MIRRIAYQLVLQSPYMLTQSMIQTHVFVCDLLKATRHRVLFSWVDGCQVTEATEEEVGELSKL